MQGRHRPGIIQAFLRQPDHMCQTTFIRRSGNKEGISVWNHRNMCTLDSKGLNNVSQDKSRSIVVVVPR
jgi:hypothetical protein